LKKKKIPLRMCLGCQEMKSKKELIRIVHNKENEVSVDITGKKNGRGAYICKDIHCFEKMKKSKKLERTFETSIPEEVYEILKVQFLG
jgi:uncharacterized protein